MQHFYKALDAAIAFFGDHRIILTGITFHFRSMDDAATAQRHAIDDTISICSLADGREYLDQSRTKTEFMLRGLRLHFTPEY